MITGQYAKWPLRSWGFVELKCPLSGGHWLPSFLVCVLVISRVSNSYDQPQLPPTKMATAENGETKLSRISGKPDRALCPYDTDMSVSYRTMYFSYDHVF